MAKQRPFPSTEKSQQKRAQEALVRGTLIRAGLTSDECRLVSGFRGLPVEYKNSVLKILSTMVLERAEGLAGKLRLSYEADVKPYRWKCDEVTRTGGAK